MPERFFMKKTQLILFATLLAILVAGPPCGTLRAAFEEKIPAARPAAMGGGFVSVANDANGVFYNPASLGGLGAANISFSQTSLFNLPDAPYMTLAAAFPTRNMGTLALGYTQFGGSLYKETELTLSQSFILARKVYFGYNLRNQSVAVTNFGSAAGMGVDVGFHAALSNDFAAGFSAGNITAPMLGATDEALPQLYRMGISYYPDAGLIFLLETSKDLLGDELAYHGGAEINISKHFTFRAGTRSNPSGISMGFGVNTGIFRINYAMVTHPVLDTQNFFTLGLKFGPDDDVAPAAATGSRRTSARRAPSKRVTNRVEQYEQVKDFKIDPNKATADELKEIPGVGALTAQRIIDHRNQGAVFTSADDLLGVPRMTKRIMERMRPYLIFDGSAAPARSTPAPSTPSRTRTAPAVVSDEQPEPDEEDAPPPPVKAPPAKTRTSPPPPPPPPPPVEAPKISVPTIAPVAPVKPVVEPAKPAVTAPPSAPKLPAPSAADDDMLNVNTASAQELQVIGFTSTQAKNIIRYRSKEGNFSSVDDILKVPGVDAKTVNNVKESITVK
ncbi:MAG: hypothetical protein CVU77_04050 [Elusimicrobia bacterium HGW-Elusimicrobia-1]|jgi:competence ComEA-like helix-hairpin-helix protein|nr:MAG: hypothetical protein CVU77_04050 [Elusimicrobia bacterium HGW-Elusimicrobia-1]